MGRNVAGRWRRVVLGALVVVALVVVDGVRSPSRQAANKLLVGTVRIYRAALSPVLGTIGYRCRLTPTCSGYSLVVLEEFGAWRGSWLTIRRLARCGPWTATGTQDPPPRVTARGAVGGAAGADDGDRRGKGTSRASF